MLAESQEPSEPTKSIERFGGNGAAGSLRTALVYCAWKEFVGRMHTTYSYKYRYTSG